MRDAASNPHPHHHPALLRQADAAPATDPWDDEEEDRRAQEEAEAAAAEGQDPANEDPWVEMTDDNGVTFYYNYTTGESAFEKPEVEVPEYEEEDLGEFEEEEEEAEEEEVPIAIEGQGGQDDDEVTMDGSVVETIEATPEELNWPLTDVFVHDAMSKYKETLDKAQFKVGHGGWAMEDGNGGWAMEDGQWRMGMEDGNGGWAMEDGNGGWEWGMGNGGWA